MNSKLNPYIVFNGNARDAITFYHSIFGGKLDMTSYKDGGMVQNPADADLLMHAQVQADNGITIMAADASSDAEVNKGSSINLSLSGDNLDEPTTYFNKLAEGGTINEPLVQAPWGDTFGMLTDKYGIDWMVNISGTQAN